MQTENKPQYLPDKCNGNIKDKRTQSEHSAEYRSHDTSSILSRVYAADNFTPQAKLPVCKQKEFRCLVPTTTECLAHIDE